MSSPAKDRTTIRVWLPNEQHARVREIARLTGISISTMVRRGIDTELARLAPLLSDLQGDKK